MEKCHWYKCRVGSEDCLAMKASGRRLFCREYCEHTAASDTPTPDPPPAEPEINLNLGAWPDEVNMEKVETAETTPPETVGAAIIQLRKAKGLSQAALADLCGVTQTSLSKWEKGKITPRLSSLQLLDEYLESDLVRRFGPASKSDEEQAGIDAEESAALPDMDAPVDHAQADVGGLFGEVLANTAAEFANVFFAAGLALNRKSLELRKQL